MNDALVYLARGREFAQLDFVQPLTNWNYAPGYSLFLAAVSPVTRWSTLAIAIVQSALFWVAVRCFVLEARRCDVLCSRREARCALLVLLGDPSFWFPLGAIGAEALAASLVLYTTTAFLRARRSRSSRLPWLPGFWVAALVLTRFEWVWLCGIGVAYLAPRKGLRSLAVLVVPILALTANAARNEIMFGEPRLFAFGSGTVMYGGNNLNLDGSWHKPVDWRTYVPAAHHDEFLRLESLQKKDFIRYVIEQDAFWRRLAVEAWRVDPVGQLLTVPLKFGKLWAMPNHFDIYTADASYPRSLQLWELLRPARWPWYGPIKHGFYLCLHFILLAMIVVGLRQAWTTPSNRPEPAAFELYALAAFAALSVTFAVPLYGLPRFHFPILPLLSIFAAKPLARLVAARPRLCGP